MLVYALGLAAAAAPAVHVCSEMPAMVSWFEAAGTMRVAGDQAPLPATLQYVCPVGNAAPGMTLILEDAPSIAFDLAGFLEPDAPAAGLPLSDITWSTRSFRTSATSAANGEPFAGSAFKLRTDRAGSGLGNLLASIGGEAGTLAWTQTSFDDLSRRFVATFELDANNAAALHDAFEKCSSQPIWLPPL